jgi:hypothetical protein
MRPRTLHGLAVGPFQSLEGSIHRIFRVISSFLGSFWLGA